MYSQHDEEVVIDLLLPNVKRGRYVDIGAAGIADSNTYRYYQMGWSGLLVEPRPDAAQRLRILRPRDTVVEVAVGDADGEVAMYHSGDLTRMVPDTGGEPVAFRCSCLTMTSLLQQYPQFRVVDFASIDVEGEEEKLLASADFHLFKPTVLIVEYNTAGRCADSRSSWEPFVVPFYERVYENGVNAFYVRRAAERHAPAQNAS